MYARFTNERKHIVGSPGTLGSPMNGGIFWFTGYATLTSDIKHFYGSPGSLGSPEKLCLISNTNIACMASFAISAQ